MYGRKEKEPKKKKSVYSEIFYFPVRNNTKPSDKSNIETLTVSENWNLRPGNFVEIANYSLDHTLQQVKSHFVFPNYPDCLLETKLKRWVHDVKHFSDEQLSTWFSKRGPEPAYGFDVDDMIAGLIQEKINAGYCVTKDEIIQFAIIAMTSHDIANEDYLDKGLLVKYKDLIAETLENINIDELKKNPPPPQKKKVTLGRHWFNRSVVRWKLDTQNCISSVKNDSLCAPTNLISHRYSSLNKMPSVGREKVHPHNSSSSCETASSETSCASEKRVRKKRRITEDCADVVEDNNIIFISSEIHHPTIMSSSDDVVDNSLSLHPCSELQSMPGISKEVSLWCMDLEKRTYFLFIIV